MGPNSSFLGACQSQNCQQAINRAAWLESERLIVGRGKGMSSASRESLNQGSVENVVFPG